MTSQKTSQLNLSTLNFPRPPFFFNFGLAAKRKINFESPNYVCGKYVEFAAFAFSFKKMLEVDLLTRMT